MPIESNKPKISVLPLEEYLDKSAEESTAVRTSIPRRALNTSRTFGSLTVDEVRVNVSRITPTSERERKEVDINGINPFTCFTFSVVAAAMSYGGWISTNYMVGHFAVKLLQSEFYPAQRAAIAARNVIVGVFMLFSGFSGAIAVGVLLLGISVAVQKIQKGWQN